MGCSFISLRSSTKMLLALTFTFFVSEVHAVLIQQTFEVTKQSDPFFGGQYSFDPFDATLGTLKEVRYAMLFQGSTNTNAGSCDGSVVPTGLANCFGPFRLFVGYSGGFDPSGSQARDFAQTDNTLEFFTGLDQPIFRSWRSSSSWGEENWDLSLFEAQPFFNYDIAMNCTNRCLGFGIDWSGSLSATVTYDYMPIPVVSTLALFSLGLAGLGWSRRIINGDASNGTALSVSI